MSFLCMPSTIMRITEPYSGRSLNTRVGTSFYPVWFGSGVDSGLFAFYTKSYGYIMANKFAPGIAMSGSSARLEFKNALVNGTGFFESSIHRLYANPISGDWVLTDRSWYAGVPPTGNIPYWRGSLPSSTSGESAVFQPYGSASGTRELTYSFPRWQKGGTTPYGVYQPFDGVSGTKTLGLPEWKDQFYTSYVRSIAKTGFWFSYGNVSRANNKWVLGEYGSADGWYEGAEPSKTDSTTFVFCNNNGQDDTITRTLTFSGYVSGDNTFSAYTTEAAIWR